LGRSFSITRARTGFAWACTARDWIAQAAKRSGEPRFIERLVHRVARAAVRQPEVEERSGRQ
jgi:hypothetical protein